MQAMLGPATASPFCGSSMVTVPHHAGPTAMTANVPAAARAVLLICRFFIGSILPPSRFGFETLPCPQSGHSVGGERVARVRTRDSEITITASCLGRQPLRQSDRRV